MIMCVRTAFQAIIEKVVIYPEKVISRVFADHWILLKVTPSKYNLFTGMTCI